ncbi:hypothetical protein FHX05_005937 [Rhizobium sp. BK491]|nr:hypothetical protein [Rhizobium sp. BK491]
MAACENGVSVLIPSRGLKLILALVGKFIDSTDEPPNDDFAPLKRLGKHASQSCLISKGSAAIPIRDPVAKLLQYLWWPLSPGW